MKRYRKGSTLMIAALCLLPWVAPMVSKTLAAPPAVGTVVQKDSKASASEAIRKPVKGVMKKELPRRRLQPTPKGAMDPDLRAEVISATPMGTDAVRIAGRITNIGGGEYVSGPAPTTGEIQLQLPHLSGPEAVPVVYSVPIVRMRSGQVLNISTTVSISEYFPDFLRWGTSSTATGECPATLRMAFFVAVSYDPDLHDDGNEQNNDDDHSNDIDRLQAPAGQFGYIADCPG